MKRILLGLVPALALGLSGLAPGTPAFAASATIAASADSYVDQGLPSTNYGSAGALNADALPVTYSYLKFTLPTGRPTPTKVTLRLFSRSTGSTVIRAALAADSNWIESGITYNNRPALGAAIASSGGLTAGTWVSLDVTPYVQAAGTYSFGISTGSTSARLFDSREAINAPQLVVETPDASPDPTLVAAGDVACSLNDPLYNGGNGTASDCHMKATANLIGGVSPTVLAMLGDGQYNSGTLSYYQQSYGASWGAYNPVLKPSLGNHDYGTTGAAGYFSYFGDISTPRQPGCRSGCNGYYSYDLGTWHIINLNAECTRINGGAGCAVGSPQEQWLKADLAAHPALCTLVTGHRPRWTSSSFASADIAPLMDDMYAAGVDVYVAGHAHLYERFASQSPSGAADANGVRQFVVGTGGSNFSGFGTTVANSQVRKPGVYGIEQFRLHAGSYDFQFHADPSTPYADSGSGTCH